jgi:hypothetical protein
MVKIKNILVTTAIDLYVSFYDKLFQMLLNLTVDETGKIIDISNDIILDFFDNINHFISEFNGISLVSVALSTIYETLFLFMNDMDYVSIFTQGNSKHLRLLFSQYLMSLEFDDFRNYLVIMLNNSADNGFIEVKMTILSVFNYFLNKEKYLFNKGRNDVNEKLREIKKAVDEGVNPVVEIYPGMKVVPFFNGKIIDLMKEISYPEKNIGGRLGDVYVNCQLFKDVFFDEFKKCLYIYRDSGFQCEFGLGQDVESCRMKLYTHNISALYNILPNNINHIKEYVNLYKKAVLAEVIYKLDDDV